MVGTLWQLARDRRGVAAVEFALLLPLMLTLWLGVVEVSSAVAIDRKVTLTSRTVADLASQVASISNTDMTNIMGASTSVMTPYTTTGLSIVVSEVTINNSGVATVTWSDNFQGTSRSVGSTVAVPAALVVNNTSLIFSEVKYAYKPTIGYVITGTLNLADQIYMRPRLSSTVSRVP